MAIMNVGAQKMLKMASTIVTMKKANNKMMPAAISIDGNDGNADNF